MDPQTAADHTTTALQRVGCPPRMVSVIPVGSLPRTLCGQVRRARARDNFTHDPQSMEPLAYSVFDQPQDGQEGGLNQQELEEWLCDRLQDAVDGDVVVDPDAPFAQYGLDSIAAIGLSGEIAEHIGRPIAPTIFYEQPTVRKLSAALCLLGSTQPAPHPGVPNVPASPSGRRRAGSGTYRGSEVAVVGLACRFPGASSPAEYWRLLSGGQSALADEVPQERTDWYEGIPAERRRGGYVQGADKFDAEFFAIGEHEARAMDPQQRMLLQVAWEALEDAGIVPSNLSDALREATGVFVGISGNDYADVVRQATGSLRDPFVSTGNASCIAANRVSYHLDLKGPSKAIDTGASSSHVAIADAVASLQRGECSIAIAGGAHLSLTDRTLRTYAAAGLLPTDGQQGGKVFDRDAAGLVPGEGVGAVVLRPLHEARAAGDRVYCVIRGAATAPPTQKVEERRKLFTDALRRSGVTPGQLNFAETAAAGVAAHDREEAEAVGQLRQEALLDTGGGPLHIGAVSGNTGHMAAAQGVASLLKAALALHHHKLPPSLGYSRPPGSYWTKLPLLVTTGGEESLSTDAVCVVSSVSLRGSAHAVLCLSQVPMLPSPNVSPLPSPLPSPRSAQAIQLPIADAPSGTASAETQGVGHLLVVSGKTTAALRRNAAALAVAVENMSPSDVCRTAARNRYHHQRRAVAVGRNSAELAEGLQKVAAEADPAKASPKPGGVCFVFSGTGGEWAGMGLGLMRAEKVFRRAVEEISRGFEQCGCPEFRPTELFADAQRLRDAAAQHAALFAVQVGLARLWQSWGVEPGAVAGHSHGEVAAAVCARLLSVRDACQVVAVRCRAIKDAPEGLVVTAEVGKQRAMELIAQAGVASEVCVSALSAPREVSFSGSSEAVQLVLDECHAEGIYTRTMAGRVPLHSHLMSSVVAAAADSLLTLPAQSSPPEDAPRFLSSAPPSVPRYWAEQLASPVDFAGSVGQLLKDGFSCFVEIGPQPHLGAHVSRIAEAEGCPRPLCVGSLQRRKWEHGAMLKAAGDIWASGAVDLRWRDVCPGGRSVGLPTYQWDAQPYWVRQDPGISSSYRQVAARSAGGEVFEHAWLLDTQWEPVPHVAAVQPKVSGKVLVFGGGDRCAVSGALRANGVAVVSVAMGRSLAKRDPQLWECPPDQCADVVFAHPDTAAVVYAWHATRAAAAAAAAGHDKPTAAGIDLVNGALSAVQSAATAKRGGVPFFVVTAGSANVSASEGGCPYGSSLWGAARAAAQELNSAVAISDLSAEPHIDEWEACGREILTVLAGPHGTESEVAFRGGRRFAARVAPPASFGVTALAPAEVRPDGTYLITGGLG
eukprot:Hpha_TRINITY_DN11736_c0_g1::TRINITY_DN11736_c0_g1_i2::g.32002::m.32002